MEVTPINKFKATIVTKQPSIRLDFVKRWLLEHWENYMFDAEMYDVRTG